MQNTMIITKNLYLTFLLSSDILASSKIQQNLKTGSSNGHGSQFVLSHLIQSPFAWVNAKVLNDSYIRIYMQKHKHLNQRKGRQHFLGDLNTPILKYNDKSAESVEIAQKISALFQSGQAVSIPNIKPVFPSINNVNLTLGGLTNKIRNPPNSETTPFQLNVNLNIELENGKPNKVRVPQGELMLMYIPQIRSPTGGAAVELSHMHLQHILKETTNPTSMVMLPTGGMLLMSLAPYNDTDSRYIMKEKDKMQVYNTIPHYDYIKQGSTVKDSIASNTNLNNAATFGRKDYNKNAGPMVTTTNRPEKKAIVRTTTFKYPEDWKNKMPKFPYVPKDNEITTQRTTKPSNDPWKNGIMPVFPHSYKNTPPPLKVNLTWPFTSTSSTKTRLITRTTTTRLLPTIITTKSPLFNNQIEIHQPRIKYQEQEHKAESTLDQNKHHLSSLYERLKNNYRSADSVQDNLQKRYRQDDTSSLGFDNVNVVVPGRFNPKPRPDGVTQCKKDSSTNGTRVCSHHIINNCQGGFKIGGNCNSQQRLDNTKLPPSEFQMGDEQVSNTNTRFVPFSPQQGNMNMQAPAKPIPPPFQLNYQLDDSRDNFVRIATSTTKRPKTTTAVQSITMNAHDAMVHRVMNMDPPQLADALMDPMMMAMGTMMAMAGAYMAIAIDELAATNALALAAGGFGGKKKKK